MQQLLGAVAADRVESKPDPAVSGLGSEPSVAAALRNARAPAWDPNEVWLNRAGKPPGPPEPEASG